jgi:hypothetical protein
MGESQVFGPEVLKDPERQVQMIRENLRIAQSHQKGYTNKWRRDQSFEVGDFIYLKVSPMRGTRRFKVNEKLAPRYVGPFHSQQPRHGYFWIFAHMRFCDYQGITTLISLVYQNRGHAQVIATNLKQRRMYNLTMSCVSSFIDSINLTMEAFLFLSLFSAQSLEDLRVSMIFEEKITSSKTSFQMASIYWWWTHIPEWCYAH